MADLEKVIKGLELCLGSIDSAGCPEECPYYEACQKYENYAVFQPLMRDALELLKEQEPLKPVLKQFKLGFHTDAVRIEPCCGGCGRKLETWYKYCSYCGRAVKLDD